jgi:hypothetical protein
VLNATGGRIPPHPCAAEASHAQKRSAAQCTCKRATELDNATTFERVRSDVAEQHDAARTKDPSKALCMTTG